MKKLVTLLMLSLSFTAMAGELCKSENLLDLYTQMNEEDREFVDFAMEEASLSENDLSYFNYQVECESEKLVTEISIDENAPLEKEQRRILWRVGIGYMFPAGVDLGGKIGISQEGSENYRVALAIDLTSSMTFKMGSFNTATIAANLYIGKKGFYLGPIFQILHINNPLLITDRNYFFKAYGLNIGWEIPITIGKTTFRTDVNAFGSFGGLNRDPIPFIYYGVGAKITIPWGQKKKEEKRKKVREMLDL